MERRRVRALRAFTEFVPGYGQVHCDPGSKDKEVSYPLMPVTVIDRMVNDEWIADDVEGGADLPQLDHDEDGQPGGSKRQDPPALTGKNKPELLDIADAEGVEADDSMTKPEIIEAIEAARAAADAAP